MYVKCNKTKYCPQSVLQAVNAYKQLVELVSPDSLPQSYIPSDDYRLMVRYLQIILVW